MQQKPSLCVKTISVILSKCPSQSFYCYSTFQVPCSSYRFHRRTIIFVPIDSAICRNHFSWSENISHNVSPSLFFPLFYLSALWVIKHPMNCDVIGAKTVTIFLRDKSSMVRAALFCTLLKHKLNGTQADLAFNQSATLFMTFQPVTCYCVAHH